MSAVQKLHSFHLFADGSKCDDLLLAGTKHYIYVRIQKRNVRETLTTVQRIADGYNKKKLVKAFKKLACDGTVIEQPEYGEVIQLPVTSARTYASFWWILDWLRTTSSNFMGFQCFGLPETLVRISLRWKYPLPQV